VETGNLELQGQRGHRERRETLALVVLLVHRELTGSTGTGDLWGPRERKGSLATKVALVPEVLLVLKVLKATLGLLDSPGLLGSRGLTASRESLATLGTTARRGTGGSKGMWVPLDSLDSKVLLANPAWLAHLGSKATLDSLE